MGKSSVGLSLPNRGVLFGATTVREMLDLATAAEGSGYFSSVWVGDGLISKPRLESIVTLSAIAAVTSTVRLGVCCLATFPLRHPVLFAAQWASLDVASGGRSLLAVCLGAATERSGQSVADELRAMGVAGGERVARFEEGVEVVRALWAGPTNHEGRFVSLREIDLQPKPVQQPCPIWIASNPDPERLSPERFAAAIDRVGRLADGWQSTVITPAEFADRWARVQESAQRHGRDPSAITSSVHLMVNINDDEPAARAETRAFLDTYYSMRVTDELMDRWGAFGPAEKVLGRLTEYLDAGLDLPILRFTSFDQTGQLERAAELVLPELAGR
jgi:alkanesulfonate monooxygenase SsuD/methylene tetrahydromethanopterin reductase-like flavin-dependent oxidoreductase (luciferase family)